MQMVRKKNVNGRSVIVHVWIASELIIKAKSDMPLPEIINSAISKGTIKFDSDGIGGKIIIKNEKAQHGIFTIRPPFWLVYIECVNEFYPISENEVFSTYRKAM